MRRALFLLFLAGCVTTRIDYSRLVLYKGMPPQGVYNQLGRPATMMRDGDGYLDVFLLRGNDRDINFDFAIFEAVNRDTKKYLNVPSLYVGRYLIVRYDKDDGFDGWCLR